MTGYAKWPKEDLQANFGFMHAFNKELKDSGVLVATEGLAWPDQAKIVRAGSDGAPVIIDGPFPEAKEFLAGYWIIDVESPEQAYRIAARATLKANMTNEHTSAGISLRLARSRPDQWLREEDYEGAAARNRFGRATKA